MPEWREGSVFCDEYIKHTETVISSISLHVTCAGLRVMTTTTWILSKRSPFMIFLHKEFSQKSLECLNRIYCFFLKYLVARWAFKNYCIDFRVFLLKIVCNFASFIAYSSSFYLVIDLSNRKGCPKIKNKKIGAFETILCEALLDETWIIKCLSDLRQSLLKNFIHLLPSRSPSIFQISIIITKSYLLNIWTWSLNIA